MGDGGGGGGRQNNFGQCTILGVKKIFRRTNTLRKITRIFEKSLNLRTNLLNFSQNLQNLSHFFKFQTKIARLSIEYCPTAQKNWGGYRPPRPVRLWFVRTRRASSRILEVFRNTSTAETMLVSRTQNRVFKDTEANQTQEISINFDCEPFLIITLYIRRHKFHAIHLSY